MAIPNEEHGDTLNNAPLLEASTLTVVAELAASLSACPIDLLLTPLGTEASEPSEAAWVLFGALAIAAEQQLIDALAAT